MNRYYVPAYYAIDRKGCSWWVSGHPTENRVMELAAVHQCAPPPLGPMRVKSFEPAQPDLFA